MAGRGTQDGGGIALAFRGRAPRPRRGRANGRLPSLPSGRLSIPFPLRCCRAPPRPGSPAGATATATPCGPIRIYEWDCSAGSDCHPPARPPRPRGPARPCCPPFCTTVGPFESDWRGAAGAGDTPIGSARGIAACRQPGPSPWRVAFLQSLVRKGVYASQLGHLDCCKTYFVAFVNFYSQLLRKLNFLTF